MNKSVRRWILRAGIIATLAPLGCSSEATSESDSGALAIEAIDNSGDALSLGERVVLNAQADTTVYVGKQNQNFGTSVELDVNRALVSFSDAQLRAALGSSDALSDARLELTLTRTKLRRLPREVGAFRLTQSWSETGATWNCPVDSNLGNSRPDCAKQWSMGVLPPNPWQSSASSVVTIPAQTTGVVSFDVSADVRAFLSGKAQNNGWMLRGSTPGEFAEFASRESQTPPQLVLRVRRCSPALCDDGNACTQDRCDASAQCVYSPAANGTACDDHNACTQSDACQAGSCTGSNPVVCAAADACHLPGTCDTCTGLCSNPLQEAGASCSGANVCDEQGSCVECLNSSTCPGSDGPCGVRTCTAGASSAWRPRASSTPTRSTMSQVATSAWPRSPSVAWAPWASSSTDARQVRAAPSIRAPDGHAQPEQRGHRASPRVRVHRGHQAVLLERR